MEKSFAWYSILYERKSVILPSSARLKPTEAIKIHHNLKESPTGNLSLSSQVLIFFPGACKGNYLGVMAEQND
ncbi:MAG: hypothetical protein ACPLZD_08390 [Candidatus Saccharicenans sp.]|nr:MAG: hypothetical protein C0168_05010 [Candidatus Aminicenantes bacterium]HEK85361.1 hypothetical protein [Candidatus Aminicenantes bacterium]